jgi:hypothetical protein
MALTSDLCPSLTRPITANTTTRLLTASDTRQSARNDVMVRVGGDGSLTE